MTPTEIEKIFRDEAGRALATLIRLVGDFDLAEDALQDAFAVALERWHAARDAANDVKVAAATTPTTTDAAAAKRGSLAI